MNLWKGRTGSDMAKSAVASGLKYGRRLQEVGSHDWIGAFTECLGNLDYVRIKWRRMQGILCAMFVRRDCLPHVTNIESEATKTGFTGYWGNKGGTSIRLDYMGFNLIVVNCHLAAHMDEVVARLTDIDMILEYQRFRDADVDNIMDHDYVFWMGDMNFRLDDTSYSEAISHIQRKNYKTLQEKDQLHQVIEEGLVFDHFKEGTINFPPTYKFDPGTDVYDTSSKQRVPAYCDRILYHYHNTTYGQVTLETRVEEYRHHPEYKFSDHKPVSGLFTINVMSKPLSQPVKFLFSKASWSRQISMVVEYRVKRKFTVNSSDWIGLYKADFNNFEAYVTYAWAQTKPANSNAHLNVTFRSGTLEDLSPGLYVLCYMTRKYSPCGISNTFKVE